MRNLIQEGETVELTAQADRQPGQIVNVGALVGIAVTAAPSGAPIQTRMTGVFSGLPTKPEDSFPAGTVAYYDASEDHLTVDADDGESPAVDFPRAGVSLGGGRFRLG